MKQFLFTIAAVATMASAMLAFSSCEKQSQPESVSVILTYSITSDNGTVMNGTKASNADVFNEFYQKIISGDLVAPSYNLVFTEKTTGAVYTVTGNWLSKDMVTLRTGSYSVVGTSTAEGDNIQEKCSLKFADDITVDTNSQTITLKANYDCSLIIFSDNSIATLNNFNGVTSAPLFKFNSYLYAFVKSQLYADGHKADAYLAGKHTNNTEFKIYTGNLNYETGKYYVYNDICTAFSLEKMEEGGAEESLNDLSATGTANCYIVPSSGVYKFKATVKGNSTESVGTPAKAEVIWETFNTSAKPNVGDIVKDVKYVDGNITFTATGKKGNALIAVKNDSDIILWSWHIWVTEYTPDSDFDVYKNHESIKVMDRNLGALSSTIDDPLSIGLLFQWGRKDPFIGSCQFLTPKESAFTNSYTYKESNSTIGTIAYALQHPCTFIHDGTAYVLDWYYDSPNNTLWGSKKTIYDPCPKGWKVPGKELVSEFPDTYPSKSDNGVFFDSSYSTPSAWFPFSCLRAPGEGTLGLADGHGRSGFWSYDVVTSGYTHCAYYYAFDKTSKVPPFAYYRAMGAAVRCVAE